MLGPGQLGTGPAQALGRRKLSLLQKPIETESQGERQSGAEWPWPAWQGFGSHGKERFSSSKSIIMSQGSVVYWLNLGESVASWCLSYPKSKMAGMEVVRIKRGDKVARTPYDNWEHSVKSSRLGETLRTT